MNVYQISVFLENRAGQLAEVTKLLAENGIDMRAISIAETKDYGVLRLIVDDTDKAVQDPGNGCFRAGSGWRPGAGAGYPGRG